MKIEDVMNTSDGLGADPGIEVGGTTHRPRGLDSKAELDRQAAHGAALFAERCFEDLAEVLEYWKGWSADELATWEVRPHPNNCEDYAVVLRLKGDETSIEVAVSKAEALRA